MIFSKICAKLFSSANQKARPVFLTILFLLSSLLILLLPRPQHAQDDEVVRVNTDLVVLNITITDQRGAYVRHLTRSNFQIFEDARPQDITTFSVEETPFAAAILLDTSGSMEGRMTLARSAAIRFLDGLRAEDTAAVYRFDSRVEQIQDFSSSRDLAPLAFGMRAEGMTVLNDAVARAARDIALRPEKRRAIIVLSDGADTQSKLTPDKAIGSAIAVGASVYTVDMSDPQTAPDKRHLAAGALRAFANKTGGRYISTPGGRALRDAFASIVDELSNQYTIGYQPTNRARDGRWRAIEVRLTTSDKTVRTRPGYRAPKS